jgi:hypothetical protein
MCVFLSVRLGGFGVTPSRAFVSILSSSKLVVSGILTQQFIETSPAALLGIDAFHIIIASNTLLHNLN